VDAIQGGVFRHVRLRFRTIEQHALLSADGNPFRAVDAVQIPYDRLQLQQRADADGTAR